MGVRKIGTSDKRKGKWGEGSMGDGLVRQQSH